MATDQNNSNVTQPIYFISHGSPMLFDSPNDPSYDYFSKLASTLPAEPKALVVISAHWEANPVTVTSSTKLIYDFYGFPKRLYQAKWPAPEDADLAKRIVEILKQVEPNTQYDPNRGIDHGTWSPLKLVFPKANIPTVQVSLKKGLDFSVHLKIGEALRNLASENILIIGSGSSSHNLGLFGYPEQSWAKPWEAKLGEVCTLENASERNEGLIQLQGHPSFELAHPREEHFLPLIVVAGAAEGKAIREHLSFPLPNFGTSCFRFEAFKDVKSSNI